MFWNLIGKFTLMILRFLESVVLVRLLGDQGYGAFSQAVNLNGIVVLLAALGLENAILRFLPATVMTHGASGERKLIGKMIALRLAASGIAVLALWQLAPFLAERLLHDAARADLIKLVGVLLLAMGLDNLLARVLVAHYEQRYINLIQAALTAAYLALASLTVWLGGGIGGVLWCLIAMHAATAAFWAWRWRRSEAPAMGNQAATAPPPTSLWRLLTFSGYTYVYNFLQFVFQKGMDVMLLGVLLDDLSPITWYVIAYNFVFYSVSFYSLAFSEGFSLAMISEVAAQGDREKLRRIFTVSVEYLYLFILPICVGGTLVGPDILRLLYPAGTAAGAIAPMLVLLYGLSFAKMSGITANFLLGLDREKTIVRLRLVFGLLNLVLDLLLIPWLHAVGPAVATSLSLAASTIYEWRITHRMIQPSYPKRFLLKILIASLGMGGVIFFAGRSFAGVLYWRVPALLLVGFVSFVAFLLVLRPFRKEHTDLIDTLPLPGKSVWLPLLMERTPSRKAV